MRRAAGAAGASAPITLVLELVFRGLVLPKA